MWIGNVCGRMIDRFLYYIGITSSAPSHDVQQRNCGALNDGMQMLTPKPQRLVLPTTMTSHITCCHDSTDVLLLVQYGVDDLPLLPAAIGDHYLISIVNY